MDSEDQTVSLLRFATAAQALTQVFAALNEIGKDPSGVDHKVYDKFVHVFMERFEAEMTPWTMEAKLATKP